MVFSMIVLRCCWGPPDYQLMLQEQYHDDTVLKELKGSYQINTLKGEDVSSFNLNMTFNDSTKQVSGFSGCNRFFGSYTIENNALKFSGLGTTRMFCTKDKNTVEDKLLKAFGKANLILFTKQGFSIYNKKKLLLSASKEIEKTSSIEYSASSRGTYIQIIINKKAISTVSKRDGKPLRKKCSTDDWERIINALKPIEIKNISELEPPSKDFQFDGAAIAQIKITHDNKAYETQPFDHGNPPKEIAELVKEILSISENIE